MEEYRPVESTLKKKLVEKYGNNIENSESPYKPTVVCFRNTCDPILSNSWYA